MDFLQCVTGGDSVGKSSKEGRAPLSLLASSPCWEMQEAEESRLQCSVALHCVSLCWIAVQLLARLAQLSAHSSIVQCTVLTPV